MTDNLPHHIQIFVPTDVWPSETELLFGRDATRFLPQNQTSKDDANSLTQPYCIAVIDSHSNTTIAALLYLKQTHDNQPIGSIHHLIIPPQHRGKGLAGQLLRRAISLAKEHHSSSIRTTAGFGCPDHIHLYQRLDFTPIPDQSQYPYILTKQL
ncbi:GNAT family N-acetyltransferase [Planctomycetota bacterium]|nr:GNAT family N-acetyltransferase [Planctomycetota bacterium]